MKLSKNGSVHFVGIGGAGMSSLAQVLLAQGFNVTGSDIKESANTKRLENIGARVAIGHRPDNINGAARVVVSSAIPSKNAEIMAARRKGIPVLQRAELLSSLMDEKRGIAVAGTHGKTTTTSMISLMLDRNGLDPTFLIGGELNDIGSGAQHGEGDFLIAEADESDGSILQLRPEMAVLTNIEADHLDYYKSLKEITEVFVEFLNRLPKDGFALICSDDPVSRKILSGLTCRYYTYGLDRRNDFRAKNVGLTDGRVHFDVFRGDENSGAISLKIPGLHNVYNALATVSLGILLKLPFEKCADALGDFSGVRRRFQRIGEACQVTFVDDYAHHPSEIRATLKAARTGDWRRVVCVFQPHRYTRTNFLHSEFGKAFKEADLVVITDVYAADEEPIPGVDGKLIVDSILKEEPYKQVVYLPKKGDISGFLLSALEGGDILLTLGAGDIWVVGSEVLTKLRNNAASKIPHEPVSI
jgi:UDP-N-acetylmuramate--alanine ligase